jgi:tetratricopeptide (TPR) repeat protein
VRRSADRIRISAQLVDATTGNHLWAERFDRNFREIFEVQDEVTRTIVSTLFGKLQIAGAELAKRKHPENLAAYDYLLRGIAYHQLSTRDDNERARAMLKMALKLDPEFAIAHGVLALAEQEDWFRDGDVAAKDRAFELAKRAHKLDPEDARIQVILGYVHPYRRDLDKAEYHIEEDASGEGRG